MSTPAKLQALNENTYIAQNARAHKRLFFGASPAKMYIYNIASAAGASEEIWGILGEFRRKTHVFATQSRESKLPSLSKKTPPLSTYFSRKTPPSYANFTGETPRLRKKNSI